MSGIDSDTHIGGPCAEFPTTQWTIVARARNAADPLRRESWDWLIARYWKPVYAYVRHRWSKTNEEAKDLTQEFFLALYDRGQLGADDQVSFRAFLKTALQHFLIDEHRRAAAAKRGGGGKPVSLDPHIELLAADPETPADTVFDREWASSLLAICVTDLEHRLAEADRPRHFAVFRAYYLDGAGIFSLRDSLGGPSDRRPTYDEVAKQLDISETDVRNSLTVARNELRRLLHEHVQAYLQDPAGVDEEITYLLSA